MTASNGAGKCAALNFNGSLSVAISAHSIFGAFLAAPHAVAVSEKISDLVLNQGDTYNWRRSLTKSMVAVLASTLWLTTEQATLRNEK